MSQQNCVDGKYQGRWGWHPCSLETCRKLKLICKFYTNALHMQGSFKRWERKTVHRHPNAPATCQICKPLKDYQVFLEDYQNARRPAATAEEVKKLQLRESQIDQAYQKCVAAQQAA